MKFLDETLNLLREYSGIYLGGIWVTLIVSLTGTIFGLALGILLSGMRNPVITPKDGVLTSFLKKAGRIFSSAYIEIVRGTPMIAQAVFIYYLLYRTLKWSPVTAGIVIVSFNTAAYMAEIIRSGIQSVDPGQREAALSVGMTEKQAFSLIILPQAIKNSFPSIGNEFVVNIKDTSVLNAISLTELYFQGMAVAGSTYRFTQSMFIIGVIYFILTFTVTRILRLIEMRMDIKNGGGIKSVSVSHV